MLTRQTTETHYALAAQLLPRFSIQVQHQMLATFGSYTAIITGSTSACDTQTLASVKSVRSQYKQRSWSADMTRIQDAVQAVGATLIAITNTDYPEQLKQISSAPPILYALGDIECLHRPQIAVVGSRRATRGGDINARQWAKALAQGGFAITSGLALGVDSSAHRGVLEVSTGKTVAVMATGIDMIYPSSNRGLSRQILRAGGVLVTEFAPGVKPLPRHFPQRNRIISGLSLGVLVVEAAEKSGSLITARRALEQNREVFAIPGSIHNPQAKGCHLLIKQGATLVESVDEIVAELHGPLGALREQTTHAEQSSALPELSQEEAELLQLIGYDPVVIDNLHTPWPMEKLSQLLVCLELKGLITNQQGHFCRI